MEGTTLLWTAATRAHLMSTGLLLLCSDLMRAKLMRAALMRAWVMAALLLWALLLYWARLWTLLVRVRTQLGVIGR